MNKVKTLEDIIMEETSGWLGASVVPTQKNIIKGVKWLIKNLYMRKVRTPRTKFAEGYNYAVDNYRLQMKKRGLL
jgi:hypothetical protein